MRTELDLWQAHDTGTSSYWLSTKWSKWFARSLSHTCTKNSNKILVLFSFFFFLLEAQARDLTYFRILSEWALFSSFPLLLTLLLKVLCCVTFRTFFINILFFSFFVCHFTLAQCTVSKHTLLLCRGKNEGNYFPLNESALILIFIPILIHSSTRTSHFSLSWETYFRVSCCFCFLSLSFTSFQS